MTKAEQTLSRLVNAAMENASKPHDQRFIQFAVPYMRKAIEKAISGHKE